MQNWSGIITVLAQKVARVTLAPRYKGGTAQPLPGVRAGYWDTRHKEG